MQEKQVIAQTVAICGYSTDVSQNWTQVKSHVNQIGKSMELF